MSAKDDRAYYARRAESERILAEQASDPAVAAIHRTMAADYLALARKAGAGERATLRIVTD